MPLPHLWHCFLRVAAAPIGRLARGRPSASTCICETQQRPSGRPPRRCATGRPAPKAREHIAFQHAPSQIGLAPDPMLRNGGVGRPRRCWWSKCHSTFFASKIARVQQSLAPCTADVTGIELQPVPNLPMSALGMRSAPSSGPAKCKGRRVIVAHLGMARLSHATRLRLAAHPRRDESENLTNPYRRTLVS